MVFGLSPFRTWPLLTTMFVVPSFSFSGCLVGFVDAVFSLLFSLSQALGKPKPFWFGFPLVPSFSCTRTPSSTRTPCSTSTPRSGSRHCVCFFFSVVIVRWSGGGRLRFVWSLSVRGVFFWVWFSLPCFACTCNETNFQRDGAEGQDILRLFRNHGGDYFLGRRVRTDIPCVTSTMTHWFGFTPPTLFLPNAVKDGPGRGWGT